MVKQSSELVEVKDEPLSVFSDLSHDVANQSYLSQLQNAFRGTDVGVSDVEETRYGRIVSFYVKDPLVKPDDVDKLQIPFEEVCTTSKIKLAKQIARYIKNIYLMEPSGINTYFKAVYFDGFDLSKHIYAGTERVVAHAAVNYNHIAISDYTTEIDDFSNLSCALKEASMDLEKDMKKDRLIIDKWLEDKSAEVVLLDDAIILPKLSWWRRILRKQENLGKLHAAVERYSLYVNKSSAKPSMREVVFLIDGKETTVEVVNADADFVLKTPFAEKRLKEKPLEDYMQKAKAAKEFDNSQPKTSKPVRKVILEKFRIF